MKKSDSDPYRDAVEKHSAAIRLLTHAYVPWSSAGGPSDCSHGVALGIPCRTCDLDIVGIKAEDVVSTHPPLDAEVVAWREEAYRMKGERDTPDAILADIESLLPPPGDDDHGLVLRVCRLISDHAADRAQLDGARKMLAEIETALPPAADGERGLAQRVKGIVARSAPRAEPAPLTDRDRSIIVPLLDIIDGHLFDDDAGHALAAVRAVVGVERG